MQIIENSLNIFTVTFDKISSQQHKNGGSTCNNQFSLNKY